MDYFLQEYKKVFSPLANKYGFRCYKRSFYRVINDVTQFFVLHRWMPFGRNCTIDFGIYPLCMGIENEDLLTASMNISTLTAKNWWSYDISDKITMNQVICDMYASVNEYLIPLLERAVDSASAYEELCSIESRIYTDIPEGLTMSDYAKVCFAVKMGAYNIAIEHLKAIEEALMKSKQRNIE